MISNLFERLDPAAFSLSTVLFSVGALAILFAAMEVLSYRRIVALEKEQPGSVVEIFVGSVLKQANPTTYARYLASMKHRELGWSIAEKPLRSMTVDSGRVPPWRMTMDHRGARALSRVYGETIVATYGDSFTFGAEVQDDETFQAYLSEELGSEAVNYGVAGYSTLQAVMRLEEHLGQGRVHPVTVLTIAANNLQRSVCRYYPYCYRQAAQLYHFSPALRIRSGVERVIPPILDDIPDPPLDALDKVAFAAAKGDLWAEHMARLRFPYSLNLLRFIARRQAAPWVWTANHDPRPFLEAREGWAVSNRLIDRFVASTRAARSQPVLMILPNREFLKRKSRGEEPLSDFDRLTKAVARRYPDLPLLDISNEIQDHEGFLLRPPGGHASPEGNKAIAKALYALLHDKNLIAAVDRQGPHADAS